jgi:hypothetical protein
MMKTIKIFMALLLFIGIGHTYAATVEDRHLSGFHAVDASGSFDVYITQGNTESVKVEAPDDVINNVLTEVSGGTLRIYSKDRFNWHNIFNNKKVTVYVTLKSIDAVKLSGAGNVTFKDGLNAPEMLLRVSGSGNMQGRLTTKALDASISGSGNLKLSGSTEEQTVSVSGSGNYSARDFTSASAKASVSGSGNASVYASTSIAAHVSGSGGVRYGGDPKSVTKSTSGSGSVERF